MAKDKKITLRQYLEMVLQKTGDSFGRQYRGFFANNKGNAELAMLASPTRDEAEQLKKAVAIMTEDEMRNADALNDEQIRKIAKDANIDSGIFAIFINGYALYCRKMA